MFLKKYVLSSFCLIVYLIHAFKVRLSNCEVPDDLSGQAFDAESAPNNVLAALAKLIVIPPARLLTLAGPVIFEGVDYDHLKNQSAKMYKNYYDCFYWQTRCLRDGAFFHAVCAFYKAGGWIMFANMCQLELENCRHRVRNETWKPYEGIFGQEEHHKDDYFHIHFYHGDGHHCKYWKFRRSVPDNQVNFYYEDEQEAIDMEGY